MMRTDLTCRELVELVTDYLEDAMPSGERSRFEAHLMDCVGCERYLEQIRAAVTLTDRVETREARTDLAALLELFREYRSGS